MVLCCVVCVAVAWLLRCCAGLCVVAVFVCCICHARPCAVTVCCVLCCGARACCIRGRVLLRLLVAVPLRIVLTHWIGLCYAVCFMLCYLIADRCSVASVVLYWMFARGLCCPSLFEVVLLWLCFVLLLLCRWLFDWLLVVMECFFFDCIAPVPVLAV